MRTGLIARDRARDRLHDLVLEAPTKASQAWFVKQFGPTSTSATSRPRSHPARDAAARPARRHVEGGAPWRRALQLRSDGRGDERGGRARASALRAVPRQGRARVLLPEGRDGAARHAASRSSRRRASSRSTPTISSRRPTSSGARSSSATTRRSRCSRARPSRTGLWETNPDLYLAIAKVEPLNRALLDLDCWITGIRRDQSPTRADAPKLGWDATHELWKANPLADWSDDDCWAYIRERGLPYNALHDRGLRVDRRHALDDPGRRPRGPLGRHREDRVRPARRGADVMSSDRPPHALAPRRARGRGDPHHARGRRRA